MVDPEAGPVLNAPLVIISHGGWCGVGGEVVRLIGPASLQEVATCAPVQGSERLGLSRDTWLALPAFLKASLLFQGNRGDAVSTGRLDMIWLVLTPTKVPAGRGLPNTWRLAQRQGLWSQKLRGLNLDSTTEKRGNLSNLSVPVCRMGR